MKRREFLARTAGSGVLLPLGASLLPGLLLGACSHEPDTGPVAVHWDRDTCHRCRMVLSDHNHAAEVRGAPAGQPTVAYKFDDIGCAVVWLEQQPWKDDPRTEIWVADRSSGAWLDARGATYVTGDLTPMGYGLGAQDASAPGLDFVQAVAHIHEVEARFNGPDAKLKDDAGKRQ